MIPPSLCDIEYKVTVIIAGREKPRGTCRTLATVKAKTLLQALQILLSSKDSLVSGIWAVEVIHKGQMLLAVSVDDSRKG
jgi:hypothetical protein